MIVKEACNEKDAYVPVAAVIITGCVEEETSDALSRLTDNRQPVPEKVRAAVRVRPSREAWQLFRFGEY